MPHTAFEKVSVVEKLPSKLIIESICTYGDYLLVGTRDGVLISYNITMGPDQSSPDIKLVRTLKNFSKKPIVQMAAIESINLLISLSDSTICLYELKSLTLINQMAKTRGATLFAVDVSKNREDGDQIRLCVAVKKKLQIYVWEDVNFVELGPDLSVPDTPRAVMWSKNYLWLGFKRSYYVIKLDNNDMFELFEIGKSPEPMITALRNGIVAVQKDDMTVFLNSDGKPARSFTITWSDTPANITYTAPYIMGILSRYLEIRLVDPPTLVQSIEFDKAKLITCDKYCYLASQSCVWRVQPVRLVDQLETLINVKEFELALNLLNVNSIDGAQKEQQTRRIKILLAFDLFAKHYFQRAFKYFTELNLDVRIIIGLFPGLMGEEPLTNFKYPIEITRLPSTAEQNGLTFLAEYLTDARNNYIKEKKNSNPNDIEEGKKRDSLLQVIDTTLLKCYIKTGNGVVKSLLRLKDNNCHIDTSVKVLKETNSLEELVILYESKGLHERALELLKSEAKRSDSPLSGYDKIISYLQKLGEQNLKLIFKFSAWVLKTSPDSGLMIFIDENTPEVESLPRGKVYKHLQNYCPELCIPYLEHIIHTWKEEESEFHNDLIKLYLQEVENETVKNSNGLFEERALLLGRLGRHDQALAIYVHVVKDDKMAEEYCWRHYNSEGSGHNEVYHHFLRMYLSPPDPKGLGIKVDIPKLEPNVKRALEILEKYYDRINTAEALVLLPPTMKVNEIASFLMNVVEDRTSRRRNGLILKSLLYSQRLQVQELRMQYRKNSSNISEDKSCRVCGQRIGVSAFARYPNGVVVHYGCCTDLKSMQFYRAWCKIKYKVFSFDPELLETLKVFSFTIN
ncbi:uncharacterized protein TRIADDRAFT_61902 [Trichoplax adhaerens]|uniref:CNH domain-containing protein n=1 Tax=Trichoplax adhaerens TaxID=10228 RepID=B3SCA5_TRIAD|nr:hypothetical protein TRIADDRAFT_61902 [Trichoplax adhaerens]EDV19627.1 hypothetical protein TRIADDRAFT_61902 [Trichoplax adhaerens]|eukprot:XP_002117865.1 hypothetical protein TRIADDRAFT_61902 [Trichoplax adhaerens]